MYDTVGAAQVSLHKDSVEREAMRSAHVTLQAKVCCKVHAFSSFTGRGDLCGLLQVCTTRLCADLRCLGSCAAWKRL